MRELYVLVSQLPAGSRVWAAENGLPFGWTLEAVLLADLYQAHTGTPHPARPTPSSSTSSSGTRASDLRDRLRKQRERLTS